MQGQGQDSRMIGPEETPRCSNLLIQGPLPRSADETRADKIQIKIHIPALTILDVIRIIF